MNRIQWALDANGASGVYTFPYNPVAIECEDSQATIKKPCIGSETVTYMLPWDGRPVSFIWRGWNFDHATFSGMVYALYSGVNNKRYIKLNYIQPMFKNILTYTGWNGPFRIEDVIPTITSEGGKSWSELKLVFHKA
jgi:hypothetical protein